MQKWMEQLKMSGPKKVILRSSYKMEHCMNKRDRCDYMVIHVTNKFESFSPQQTCLLHTQGVIYLYIYLHEACYIRPGRSICISSLLVWISIKHV